MDLHVLKPDSGRIPPVRFRTLISDILSSETNALLVLQSAYRAELRGRFAAADVRPGRAARLQRSGRSQVVRDRVPDVPERSRPADQLPEQLQRRFLPVLQRETTAVRAPVRGPFTASVRATATKRATASVRTTTSTRATASVPPTAAAPPDGRVPPAAVRPPVPADTAAGTEVRQRVRSNGFCR